MSEETRLEDALERAYTEAGKVVDFGRELWDRSATGTIRPRMHQIIRIHEAVKNGAKRMLFEDTTSAGKTLTAVAIKGLLDEDSKRKGKQTRALVVAPNQAIESAWSNQEINKYTRELRLPHQESIHVDEGNITKLLHNDFILLNYDKLSREDKGSYTNEHLRKIRELIPHIDNVIVDEGHNLKNVYANRTKAFRDIVEGTLGKPFLILSASAIPNTLKDAGSLLYMLDPVKYRHYATNPFDYTEDRYSLKNAKNSGAWFTFSREDLKALFGLPPLISGDPEIGIEPLHRFDMDEEDARRYFDAWKREESSMTKIAKLSRILLRSEFNELERLCLQIRDKSPEAQISVFSFYTEGFSEELANRLRERFPNEGVGLITGNTPGGSNTREKVKRRIELAKRFTEGDLRFLVNTSSTVSESIPLTTEDRPVYLIFAQPPVVPATHDQTIGRFYRIFQKAPVYFTEMIPRGNTLNEWQTAEVERRKNEGVKFRSSWEPGTLFENAPEIRKSKIVLRERVLGANAIDDLMEIADVTERSEKEGAYTSLPKEAVKEKDKSPNKRFNDGLKVVRYCMGRPVEVLRDSEEFRRAIVRTYASKDFDETTSAETNRAITGIIHSIENVEGRLDNILDWGSGPACLARILRRPIWNLDAIEGHFEEGKAAGIRLGIYDPAEMDKFFVVGNARNMPFPNEFFDLVSSSYAIQYNAQGLQDRRDVEEILKETNRVMKDGGHGILALPSKAGTISPEKEVEDFRDVLLPTYGFDVRRSGFVTGYATNPSTGREIKVFNGAHILLYKKKESQTELIDTTPDVITYAPYRIIGIGGTRKKKLRPQNNKYGGKTILTERFIWSDGSPLESGTEDIVHSKQGKIQ